MFFLFTVMIGALRSTLANFLFPDFDLIWNFVRIPFYDVAVQDKHNWLVNASHSIVENYVLENFTQNS